MWKKSTKGCAIERLERSSLYHRFIKQNCSKHEAS